MQILIQAHLKVLVPSRRPCCADATFAAPSGDAPPDHLSLTRRGIVTK